MVDIMVDNHVYKSKLYNFVQLIISVADPDYQHKKYQWLLLIMIITLW